MKCIASVICIAVMIPTLRAESLPAGTYARRPNNDGISSTLIIEAAGTGQKLTFKIIVAGGGTSKMICTTQLDGKDATVFVDGKPSPQTMAIRMTDSRHGINVLKLNGQPMATQKSEISADGRVIKVESTAAVPGQQNGIEYWDKK